jgi:hypothetical protein
MNGLFAVGEASKKVAFFSFKIGLLVDLETDRLSNEL